MSFVENYSNDKLKRIYNIYFWGIGVISIVLYCSLSYILYNSYITGLNSGNPAIYNCFFILGLISISLALLYTKKDIFYFLRQFKTIMFPVLSAAILIFVSIAYINASGLTFEYEVRMAFVLAVMSLAIITVILFVAGKLNLNTVVYFIIILGFILRLAYTINSHYTLRQHDVDFQYGHLGYIQYIADNNTIPDSEVGQMYHPPLHHILSAIIFKISNRMGHSQDISVKMIQFFMVFLSSLSLYFIYKMLSLIKEKPIFVIPGVILFSFHPYNIYLASYVNNDGTLMFFYILSLYFLIRWYKESTMHNIILTAVFTMLAIVTKKSGYMLLPIIFSVFLMELIKNKSEFRKYFIQYISFAAVLIPLPLAVFLRSLILFGHGLNYFPVPGLKPMDSSLDNLISFSIKRILSYPFPGYAFDINEQNKYFLEYAFKSSLFGEWDFNRMIWIARIMSIFAFVIYVLTTIYVFFMKKKDFFKYGYIFIMNALIPLALFVKFRLGSPFVCTQNFRYLLPMLVSLSFFMSQITYMISKTRFKFIGNVILFSVIAIFSAFSTVFILGIGL